MRLTQLEPQFLRLEYRTESWTRQKDGGGTEEVTGPREYHVFVDTPQEADGISFVCPQCFKDTGKREGCHSVICWTPKIPQDVSPKPGRWNLIGTNYEDLSLVAGSSSVSLPEAACRAHFLVTKGEVTFC